MASSKKSISYTQVSMYNECPFKWKLNYIDGLREFKGNIHTLFGSAMHEVIQTYLDVMYSRSIKAADALPLDKLLKARMTEQFNKMHEFGTKEYLVNKEDMGEFYNDGLLILDFFKKRRGEYFSNRGYKLLGCEVAIDFDIPKNLRFVGYLDIVIHDTVRDVIQIIDIKTSTMGWNKWQKKNTNKTAQLLLYKKFYSEQYNHPIDKIDVEYFILKRKLYENMDFPQKRVQKFSPASGKPSMNKTLTSLKEFVDDAFTESGEYDTSREFKKLPSAKNCKWCEFKTKPELCDRKK
jgi:hypothetical protein